MHNNTTLSNMSQPNSGCNSDNETLRTERLYTYIIASVCSFIGNLLVILIVYRNKNLRTSINYFRVNMSVSDILYPLFVLLYDLKFRSFRLSKLNGKLLCKPLHFMANVSFEVSMLTLVVIAVYRFSAVMFPLRARVQNIRKCISALLLTWVIPMAMNSPILVYLEFNEQNKSCFWKMNRNHYRSGVFAHILLFFFLPVLIMLVLYPSIVIKLKQHRVPGNVISIQPFVRRRDKRNFRLTMMFIVLTVAFLLCWGPSLIYYVLLVMEIKVEYCIKFYLWRVSIITRVVFHAINPVLYFIFLSSFRQGFKNVFRSSCCNKTKPQAPADNFELNNIPQGLHNN